MARTGMRNRCFFLLPLVGLVGCSTIEGHPVRWPWSKTPMLAERYELPPETDPRFNNPPTYPKHTMVPQLKVEQENAARRGFSTSGMGAGMPMPGGMPGGR